MATLNISDLSVGDWILNHRGFPTKVQVITSEGNILCGEIDAKSEHCTHLWVQDIHPIPITPEILEKNGFMRCSVEFNIYEYTTLLGKILRTTQVHLDGTQCIRVFVHDTTIERGFCRREKISVSILKDKVYIHELQHALRLAGVDKEIVMPNK